MKIQQRGQKYGRVVDRKIKEWQMGSYENRDKRCKNNDRKVKRVELGKGKEWGQEKGTFGAVRVWEKKEERLGEEGKRMGTGR